MLKTLLVENKHKKVMRKRHKHFVTVSLSLALLAGVGVPVDVHAEEVSNDITQVVSQDDESDLKTSESDETKEKIRSIDETNAHGHSDVSNSNQNSVSSVQEVSNDVTEVVSQNDESDSKSSESDETKEKIRSIDETNELDHSDLSNHNQNTVGTVQESSNNQFNKNDDNDTQLDLKYNVTTQDIATYQSIENNDDPISSKLKDNENSEESFVLTEELYQQSTALELANLVRSGKVTSRELVDMAYSIIEKTNPDLNNIVALTKEQAYKKIENLEDTGQPFYGVPLLVKGMSAVEGSPNSVGIPKWKDRIASRDGRHVRILEEAGFITIGTTTFPQYGWINVTNSELYGSTRNPWNLKHNPGGSSGGSSAAVAAGQVPIATSSDAGGSTRIPAAWSGLIGLHPSRGSLQWDTSNPNNQTSHFVLTKDMFDLEAVHDFLLDTELNDVDLTEQTPIAYTTQTPAGTPISEDAVKAVLEAAAFLESLGYNLVEVDYPVDGEQLMHQYYTIAASSAPNMPREDVELLTWALAQAGKEVTRDDRNAAWDYAHGVADYMSVFFETYPIFLTPTNAWPAPEHDYNHIPEDLKPLMEDMTELNKEERLQLIYDQWLPAWTKTPYTQLSNLTGLPSISLPTYLNNDHLPMGVMFMTDLLNEKYLFQLGHLFQEHNKFKMLGISSPFDVVEENNDVDDEENNDSNADRHIDHSESQPELEQDSDAEKKSEFEGNAREKIVIAISKKESEVTPVNAQSIDLITKKQIKSEPGNNSAERLPDTATSSWALLATGLSSVLVGLGINLKKED